MKTIILIISFVFCFLFSNAQTFTCDTGTVTDIDGNVYQTVTIGTQCWMKENMRTTRYASGQSVSTLEITNSAIQETVNMVGKLQVRVVLPRSEILQINVYDISGKVAFHTDLKCYAGMSLVECTIGPAGMHLIQINGSAFKVIGSDGNKTAVKLIREVSMPGYKSDSIVISDTSRNYFDYGNDPAKGVQYGKLYTARSALNVNSPPYPDIIQGLCPDGWHVANDMDWMQLEMTAGMSQNDALDLFEYRGTISNKLKIAGPEWHYNDGTDDFGFSAKGSGFYGCRLSGCLFYLLTEYGTWWTYDKENLMIRQLNEFDAGVWRGYFTSENGALSVRCVKN